MNNRRGVAETEKKAGMEQALAYFRSHAGLKHLLDGFVEKYRVLGRFGGIVILNRLSAEERADIEAFFRKRLPDGMIRISAAAFAAALAKTCFGSAAPPDLLAAWHGGEIISRREERLRLAQEREAVLLELRSMYPHPYCRLWLETVLERSPAARTVQLAFERDADFMLHMGFVLQALGNLPQQYERLPVFSRRICGDPHGLDVDREAGKLFVNGLRALRLRRERQCEEEQEENADDAVSNAEQMSQLYYEFHLLRDDLLNFVTCAGLAARDEQGELDYWRSAAAIGAPLNAPLREIVRTVCFQPARNCGGFAGCPVYIVENSGVFSVLLDEDTGVVPLVCLHGQLKTASWALLDRLAASGAQLLYSGDFDPEGLQIADKLLRRYPGTLALWRMSVRDYWAAQPATALDGARIKKLASIQSPGLKPLVQAVAQSRLAAYQEGILELLSADLRTASQAQDL